MVEDITWCLSGFNFKRLGFATTNPGTIPVGQLQWDEYFFLPYYEDLDQKKRVQLLL
jgi:hypothetical protein